MKVLGRISSFRLREFDFTILMSSWKKQSQNKDSFSNCYDSANCYCHFHNFILQVDLESGLKYEEAYYAQVRIPL